MSLKIGTFVLQTLLQLASTYTPILGPFLNWFYTPLDIILSGVLGFFA